jgi:phosphoserine aminotransferase
MSALYFTPGPSALYPTYAKHLQAAMDQQLGSVNHRSATFRKIYQFTDEQLRILMDIPKGHGIYFASSATEIWERMILNLVETHSFHFVNGSFSARFYDFSKALQKSPLACVVDNGKGFERHQLTLPHPVSLLCTTQNETSTGVQFPEIDLYYLKDRYPDTLLCCDLVSVAPYAKLDYQKVDSSFFSVQKCFGMPPGLGVWIANEACLNQSARLQKMGINIGAHHTLVSYAENAARFETPSTPNVMAIYILGKIAEDMNQKGIENIRQELDEKAQLVYDFAVHSDKYQAFVTEKNHQSKTVIVLETEGPSAKIIEDLQQKNIMIGSGYGPCKEQQIRIANFPATTPEDMKTLLASL